MATRGTPQTVGRNTLVLETLPRTRGVDVRDDLHWSGDPDELDVLEVSYARSPARILDDWRSALGTSPRRLVVLSLDRRPPRDRVHVDRAGCRVTIESANPHDLTEFGMRWQRALDRVDGPQAHPLVEFDSVTSMLQFVDVRTAYQFVHCISAHVREIGAHAQFYLDPDAHEERVVQVFRSTVDDIRREESDGSSASRRDGGADGARSGARNRGRPD
ncbi:MAG: hypothetical protein ABEJ28_07125 [Salinigranum sp.]